MRPDLDNFGLVAFNRCRFNTAKVGWNPKKQDHVSNIHFGLRGKPAIDRFSEHPMLFHRFSPRHCEWRGAELKASTKGFSVPWRMRLVKAFDPIPYPGEVRSMKQIDHEKTSGRVAGRYEGQLEFGVKQLRGVMLKFGLWHSSQIQTPATGCRRRSPWSEA